jgi:hypothetical protein
MWKLHDDADQKGQVTMPRILIRVGAAVAAVTAGTFTILLVINTVLFVKLKRMFRYGIPTAEK